MACPAQWITDGPTTAPHHRPLARVERGGREEEGGEGEGGGEGREDGEGERGGEEKRDNKEGTVETESL